MKSRLLAPALLLAMFAVGACSDLTGEADIEATVEARVAATVTAGSKAADARRSETDELGVELAAVPTTRLTSPTPIGKPSPTRSPIPIRTVEPNEAVYYPAASELVLADLKLIEKADIREKFPDPIPALWKIQVMVQFNLYTRLLADWNSLNLPLRFAESHAIYTTVIEQGLIAAQAEMDWVTVGSSESEREALRTTWRNAVATAAHRRSSAITLEGPEPTPTIVGPTPSPTLIPTTKPRPTAVRSNTTAAPVEIGRWSGNGAKITGSFRISQSPWTLKYKLKGLSVEGVEIAALLSVFVMKSGEAFAVALPVNTTASTSGRFEQSFVHEVGTFHLEIKALGDWEVVVIAVR